MKQHLSAVCLTFCLLLGMATILPAQNAPHAEPYDSLWQQVKNQEEESLPQSSSKIVARICQQALKEKNSQQLLKALIHLLKYQQMVDENRFPEQLQMFEAYAEKSDNTAEKSVLHALLANLYLKYYQSNSRSIGQRTALGDGYIPDDIREWTGNIFVRKIAEKIKLSLQATQLLQSTDILQYEEILETGDASRNLRPTLYDFLAAEVIRLYTETQNIASRYFQQTSTLNKQYFCDAASFAATPIVADDYDFTLQALNVYRQLLAFRLQDNNLPALLSVDLDRLKYVYEHSADENYILALQALEKRYAGETFVVEALSRQANYYFPSGASLYLPAYGNLKELTDKELENRGKVYDLCREGIRKYPSYERIGLLKNKLKTLTASQINATFDGVSYPGKELQLKISYQNVPQLEVSVYRLKIPVSSYVKPEMYKTHGEKVEEKKVLLNNPLLYIPNDTVLTLSAKEPGLYEIVFSSRNGEEELLSVKPFSVSKLTALCRNSDERQETEILVADRLSGKPVEKATINLYKRKNDEYLFISSVSTDKNGLSPVISDKDFTHYQVSYREDVYLPLSFKNYYYGKNQDNLPAKKVLLFADRSIYRPGQTIFFKGIITQADKDPQQQVQQQVLPSVDIQVYLFDSQGRRLAKKVCRSNEFGSFAGEFTLPQQAIGGVFSLTADYMGHSSFRVEEYKRPTFDITLDTIAVTYNFGDTIPVTGTVRTFSGIALQEQVVNYRIVRKRHWYWAYSTDNNTFQVAKGTVTTDKNGHFLLSFPAERPDTLSSKKAEGYIYEIEISVTGTSGETQQQMANISIGDRSMYLDISALSDVDKNHLSPFCIQAFNLDGKAIVCKINYRIARLTAFQSLEKIPDSNAWTEQETVASGVFTAGDSLMLPALAKVSSGKYRISLQATDDKGRMVEESKDFVLYSLQDKRPPVVVYEWLVAGKTTCVPGENTEIVYGSSAENAYVLYEIYQNGQRISLERFVLNNANKRLLIPFKASYGEGVDVIFTFIKDAKLFTKKISINRKAEDKSLRLKLDVFRDKLLPGQTEEWKLSVRNADGKAVLSEILANMYDRSLDKIYKNDWYFYPADVPYRKTVPVFSPGGDLNHVYLALSLPKKWEDVPTFAFDAFNWFGLNFSALSIVQISDKLTGNIGSMRIRGLDSNASSGNLRANTAEVASFRAEQAADIRAKSASIIQIDDHSDLVSLRSDFNETAFFYPQLRTNGEGETLISFTVPESNTAWTFRALAHTKDVKYGQLTKQIISQKPLMVTPNMPRFVRQGDVVTITSNVSNVSENVQSGNVQIELLDLKTEKPVIIPAENIRSFNLEKGQTTAVSWSFHVPEGLEMLVCKIIARSEAFSDGEQHLLPVLPNRILVTESLPLFISGKGSKQFHFDKFMQDSSSTASNYRLTLEFTGNPVWYAVQALPTMNIPEEENAVSSFASYYTNSLATTIANSNPKIKQVVDAWQKEEGSATGLVSNLEKNQALKAVLLEETPWVLEAANETEQQQRLSLLFDVNRNGNLSSEAIRKLKELQLEDGGWSWFKGMYSNVSITQWILYGMGQLEHLNAIPYKSDTQEMQEKALSFIDRTFKKAFDTMKKNHSDYAKMQTIGSYELEYLYVRSFYPTIPAEASQEATAFYLDLIDKYWAKNTGLYQRALSAIILQRHGQKATALKIAKSLREHATIQPETGMYWANNKTHSFFFQSITTVHTFIMQALMETGVSPEESDAMKLWLLKQKQTQHWESTPATTNAIYALLNTGTDWLNSKGEVSLQLGKQTVQTEQQAGTGYLKKVYHTAEILPDMGTVTISKYDDGPAYGALYRQYFEEMDRITSSTNNLSVDKKLFIEKTTEVHKTLVPLTTSQTVSVGDKVIVRLTVRTDRDMEYVMLKDLRAACFEPVEQISQTKWRESITYYQHTKDASTLFYFDRLPKGTYVFEYAVYASRPGTYSNGTATIQCLYAPEFVSHTGGERVSVEDF
ncbi:MAG: hypothetical protein LBM08_09705 [Dysgonamonadaceae bacterium]|nr:hypothetical protein [Dysgonamonadaceae bacterium]